MTLDDIKRRCNEAGYTWFDPREMRKYRRRVFPRVYSGVGGAYFVASVKLPHTSHRHYIVNRFDVGFSVIEPVSEAIFHKLRAVNLATALADGTPLPV